MPRCNLGRSVAEYELQLILAPLHRPAQGARLNGDQVLAKLDLNLIDPMTFFFAWGGLASLGSLVGELMMPSGLDHPRWRHTCGSGCLPKNRGQIQDHCSCQASIRDLNRKELSSKREDSVLDLIRGSESSAKGSQPESTRPWKLT